MKVLRTGDYSLVVEYNVRQPDVLGRHVQFRDAAVFRRVPRELVVVPLLQTGQRAQVEQFTRI